jgi:hypothetical protein
MGKSRNFLSEGGTWDPRFQQGESRSIWEFDLNTFHPSHLNQIYLPQLRFRITFIKRSYLRTWWLYGSHQFRLQREGSNVINEWDGKQFCSMEQTKYGLNVEIHEGNVFKSNSPIEWDFCPSNLRQIGPPTGFNSRGSTVIIEELRIRIGCHAAGSASSRSRPVRWETRDLSKALPLMVVWEWYINTGFSIDYRNWPEFNGFRHLEILRRRDNAWTSHSLVSHIIRHLLRQP